MNTVALKELLKQYEQNKIRAEISLENKLQDFYNSNKKLLKINDEINSTAINISKSILLNKNSEEINNLKAKLEKIKKEKEEYLSKLDLSETFFKPDYSCKICSDTGYLNNNLMCNCLKQKLIDLEYNKSNIFNIKKENFDFFNLNLYSDEINQEKYNSNISPKENIKNIKNIIDNFILNFDNPNEKNLLFTGNTGLGKTFLSSCIANEILKKGNTVLYQTAPAMLDSIIDYKFGKTKDSFVYDNILNADLLIIDDLGTESLNNFKFSELFNIINTRILNQNNHVTKTIISTNLNLNNLFKNYDERIVSRFVGYYNICRFFGEDIRFKKM